MKLTYTVDMSEFCDSIVFTLPSVHSSLKSTGTCFFFRPKFTFHYYYHFFIIFVLPYLLHIPSYYF